MAVNGTKMKITAESMHFQNESTLSRFFDEENVVFTDRLQRSDVNESTLFQNENTLSPIFFGRISTIL